LALKLGLVLSGAQIFMQPSTPPEARRWAEQDHATEVAWEKGESGLKEGEEEEVEEEKEENR